MARREVAVIGSGNIGTDLMMKIIRLSSGLQMGVMVGIDPSSDGLARARRLGVPTTDAGVDGLIAMPNFGDIGIVFDATSAKGHIANAGALAPYDKRLVDLTPAAIGRRGQRVPAPGPTSTSSPRPRLMPSSPSAGPAGARPSLSSIRLIRR